MKWSLVLVSLVLVATAVAGRPDFDPKDVVRQVRPAHPTPRSLDPSIPALDEGEFLIDTSTTLVPAAYSQGDPAIAFDGTNSLVVWGDWRSGHDWDIYGARVTPQGTVLDPEGIIILQEAFTQTYPDIVYDGSNFLVVWEDWRDGEHADIYGARVTPQGRVLDPGGIAISAGMGDQQSPAVAPDGANCLVVWKDCRNGPCSDIYGARVTPQGIVLDPDGVSISTATFDQWRPALAFDGADYLVAWEDFRAGSGYRVYGCRVTPGGTVLDPEGIPISTEGGTLAVAFDGTNFLVVWGGDDICGARVTPGGVVLDTSGLVISQEANYQWGPAIAFDGMSYLVAWADERCGNPDTPDIYGARVTPAGTVLDPDGIPISTGPTDEWYPALAFNGTDFLVVWGDERTGYSYDIYGARVAPGGIVRDPTGIVISQAADDQYAPAAAFDGEDFLVVWEDQCCGVDTSDIYGARVTPAGVVLDGAGIVISSATHDQHNPSLAFDGANSLVVWEDARSGNGDDIYGARVTPQGTVLDPEGIAISQVASDQCAPAVCFDGTNYLVVWEDMREGEWDIYGARVTPAGAVLEPEGIALSSAALNQRSPALAFDGTNYTVVWRDRRGSDATIYGARVTPQGTVLDPEGFVISQAADWRHLPVLVCGGANFFVVWEDSRSGCSDIYGARVTPQGTVLDPDGIAISTAADYQLSPAVAFDGTNCLVIWEDWRAGSNPDIYGARVTPGGTAYDEGAVVRQEGGQKRPALACGTGNQMFLVYDGWAGTVGNKGYNAYRIWGKMNPSPAVEERQEPIANRQEPMATVVRGELFLSCRSDFQVANRGTDAAPTALLDACGRTVMELEPGPNDVRHLAPGVYFIEEGARGQGAKGSRAKVVILD